MPDLIDKLDPRIVAVVLDAAKEVAAFLWSKLTDSSTKPSKDALKAIERRAVEALLDEAKSAAILQATIAGIAIDLTRINLGIADVLAAFDAPTHPTVPVLNIELEEVSPEEWDRTHPKKTTI